MKGSRAIGSGTMSPSRFEPTFRSGASPHPVDGSHRDPIVFSLQDQDLLVRRSDAGFSFPRRSELDAAGVRFERCVSLGSLDGEPCVVASLDASVRERLERSVVPGLTLRGLRSLFGALDDATFAAAGLAAQLAHFDDTSRRCGRCGEELAWKAEERAKRCPSCSREVYPHVSPCAIVIVEDPARDAILMSRGARFPEGMYGLVAGFVEPGESLEACAAREVLEETAIRIEDVRYAGSQPWPFPSQLMVGFTARYAGGEIVVDETELEDARWFARDAMPMLPPVVSIARRLIDRWLASPAA